LLIYKISEFASKFFGITVHRTLLDERRRVEMVGISRRLVWRQIASADVCGSLTGSCVPGP
jgi:hypothetical protein